MAQTSKQVRHRKLRHRASYQNMLKNGALKKIKLWLANQGGSNGRY